MSKPKLSEQEPCLICGAAGGHDPGCMSAKLTPSGDQKMPCGCVWNDVKGEFTTMCEEHEAELDAEAEQQRAQQVADFQAMQMPLEDC